ncbi:hypothetical protein ACFWN7_05495 [Agromyces sp. NPDC058484]|uniref:hypothetical protein n=1 Tax=Agromyces sp. NPDC058484 TaxID=3346524 RepID=UPI003655AB73
MNTTKDTQRIIATAIIAVTAGLALASCAQEPVPEPVRQLTSEQTAELRSGLEELAESRAEMARDLAEQRATVLAAQAEGMLDLAESRAEMYRDLAEQRAAADTDAVDCGSGAGGSDTSDRPAYLDQLEKHLRLGQ